MKNVYSIGEQEPFRLTQTSARCLLLAICMTNSEVVAASIDTTCPPTHVILRIRIDVTKLQEFKECFPDIEPVEEAKGQQ
jgi:hypothetical protein